MNRVRSKLVPTQTVKVDRGSGGIYPFILNNILNNSTEGDIKPINSDRDLRLSRRCWRLRAPAMLHHVIAKQVPTFGRIVVPLKSL